MSIIILREQIIGQIIIRHILHGNKTKHTFSTVFKILAKLNFFAYVNNKLSFS